MIKDFVVRSMRAEKFTPIGIAEKLGASAILESASFEGGRSRYSILMIDEAFRIVQEGEDVIKKRNGGWEKLEAAADILEVCEEYSKHFSFFDFPFPAGGIGYLSYEFAGRCDSIFFRDKLSSNPVPDGIFMFGNIYIVFDHYTDLLYIVGVDYEFENNDDNHITGKVDDVFDRINDYDFNYLAKKQHTYKAEIADDSDAESFAANVASIKQEIIDGNILQAVLSRKLAVKSDIPAIDAFKNLRAANPSPYMFYLDFGDFQLFGASPEVHLKVEDGKAEMRPIAGTRRRGADKLEDLDLEKELLADEKEASEHLMLVDLSRNDLGRTCKSGSVKVAEYRVIERFSHVMHIVSGTEGLLKPEATTAQCIRATFPAGTVSGAPKISAMSIVDRLEKERRGFYAGLAGYFGAGGNFDSCITIRSCMKKGDMLYLQAGAGIVADSNPERELEETNEKLRAAAGAVGIKL